MAVSATLHYLTGCAIGEIAGLSFGTDACLSNGTTTAADRVSIATMEVVDNGGHPGSTSSFWDHQGNHQES